MDAPLIQMAIGKRASDANPEQKSFTPGQLAELFSEFREGEKDGPYFIPAKLNGSGRKAENVRAWHGAVLDLDDASNPSEQKIRDALEGFVYFAYTTWSHAQGAERWRVCVPYSQPVTPPIQAQVAELLHARFPGVDSCGKKSVQLFYLNAHRPGCGAEARAFNTLADGTLLNPVTFIDEQDPQQQSVLPQLATKTPGSVEDWCADLLNGEDLHGNAVALTMRMAGKGLDKPTMLSWFEGVRQRLEASRGPLRVAKLFGGELNRMIDGALQRIDAPAVEAEDGTDLINKLMGDLEVSEKDAEKYCDPDWVYPNLIIEGHITVIPAEPNGGKTTLFWNLCPVFNQRGYDVFYVNADISGGDAKRMIPQAKAWGVTLYLPDMGEAKGMHHVVQQLATMAKSGHRFDRKVFIFDTLKKMEEPNSKGGMRALFLTLRGLTAQGMTVVLLAHTLKYYGADGLPQFEGVGDIKSDCDDLIYLFPSDEPGGSKVISTLPDKKRGHFERISFRLNADRTITPLDKYHDLKAEKAQEAIFNKDLEDIQEIHEFLQGGAQSQGDICKGVSPGRNRAMKLLRRYKGKQWLQETRENNSKWYTSLPPARRYPPEFDIDGLLGKPGQPVNRDNRETEIENVRGVEL